MNTTLGLKRVITTTAHVQEVNFTTKGVHVVLQVAFFIHYNDEAKDAKFRC